MTPRKMALLGAAMILWMGVQLPTARADNQMGYKLVSQQDVANLPRTHATLGIDVERAQQITSQGITFDIIRVKQVRRASPGERAGLSVGDQIIAVDGHVFGSLIAFAGYIGSLPPGSQASVDYMPAQGGPAQAERVTVTLAPAGQPSQNFSAAPGMSTGTKVAIGVGAVALIGCYEMGCFTHRHAKGTPSPSASPAVPDGQPYGSPNSFLSRP